MVPNTYCPSIRLNTKTRLDGIQLNRVLKSNTHTSQENIRQPSQSSSRDLVLHNKLRNDCLLWQSRGRYNGNHEEEFEDITSLHHMN